MKDTKYENHKSWGMVGLFRQYSGGGTHLFGSDVSNHSTICLKIKHAIKKREFGRDWTMGDDTICEVELSAVQYAELLTNMNVGDGVPCTIRYTNTDGHIEYKEEKSKIEIIRTERNEVVEKASTDLKEVANNLRDLINNKKIPKTVGEELLHKLTTSLSNLEGGGFAFYKKQAMKEVDEMIVEAKSQISEHIDHKIHSVGLETLMKASEVTPMINGAEHPLIKDSE